MIDTTRCASAHQRTYLTSDWEFCATPTDSVATPDALGSSAQWQKTTVPATAAASLRSLNLWSLDQPARRFDAEDWWYRCRFPGRRDPGAITVLGFDGLATIAEVWLNGKLILASESMFIAHEIVVDEFLRDDNRLDNELTIRFRSLDKQLAARRPRPSWRVPMIDNQQLRWFRTTLLGRTPGWSPPAAAVGPWRPIWLEQRRHFTLVNTKLHATVAADTGVVAIELQLAPIGGNKVVSATVVVTKDAQQFTSTLELSNAFVGSAQITVAKPELWWPHTHGEPALYTAKVLLTVDDGQQQSVHEIALGSFGFRTIAVNTVNGTFEISVNGATIFCRGACWTPLDIASLGATLEEYRRAIEQVRRCGMNMLRVGGTMVYEADAFYDECDRQGILLWQDFMFANMDYPDLDASFLHLVSIEVNQQLARLASRPALAVFCGNSEVEQQAAMWGASRERWQPALFYSALPNIIRAATSTAHYWPSSATGGSFPHQASVGTTSYYGVGAYLKSIDDARRSEVRFATECLAFANVPDDNSLASMSGGLELRVHHPQWKARSPRDLGAGWDFEDVRDHYVKALFNVDPLAVRYSDHDRYLYYGRVATAEVMAATFSEWRRAQSRCHGALIWFLRDLWLGAGWGVIDALGQPKSPYFQLRRVLQPQVVTLSDEGVSGLHAHLVNELPSALHARLEIARFRGGEFPLETRSSMVELLPRSNTSIAVCDLFDGFIDLTYSYRFGPLACNLVVARLIDANETTISEAFYLPAGLPTEPESDLGLKAIASKLADGGYTLTITTRRFAHSVTIRAEHYDCEDQYFHLAPGANRTLHVRPLSERARGLRGDVLSLNAAHGVAIQIVTTPIEPT